MPLINLKSAATVFLVLMLSGCAFGRKIDYQGVSSFTNPQMVGMQGVMVLDKRPYVLSGTKSPEWVGLSRSLFGIPYGVHTQSGQPLATDMAGLIAATLRNNGASVITVAASNQASMPDIALAFRNAGAARGLLFELKQWRTDVWFGTAFDFDVVLKIVTPDGQLLGETSYAGKRSLSSASPLSDAVTEIFSKLLNSPEIKLTQKSAKGLARPAKQEANAQTKPSPVAHQHPSCSTDQILKMRDLGISPEQIKAACPSP